MRFRGLHIVNVIMPISRKGLFLTSDFSRMTLFDLVLKFFVATDGYSLYRLQFPDKRFGLV